MKFMRHSVLDYLGKISYGIYMYHVIVIGLIIQFMIPWQEKLNLWIWNGTIYLVVPTLTVFVAAMSYKFFETPLLHLKERYGSV